MLLLQSSVIPPGMFAWILVYALSSCGISDVATVSPTDRCAEADFYMSSDYNRGKNRSETEIYFGALIPYVTLQGDQLVTSYPWMNVSDMELERRLATSQAALLQGLVSKFSTASRIFLDYRIAGVTALVIIRADDKMSVTQAGQSTSEELKGIDSATASYYANNQNLTAFLQSSSAVFSRWKRICEDTVRRDTINTTTMTLRYNSSTSEFTCYVQTPIPVDHEISYRCISENGKTKTDDIMSDRIADTRIAIWEDYECNLTTARCIVRSYSGWTMETGISIEDLPKIVAQTASGGANVAISVVVILCALGCLFFTCYKYRSIMSPVNDLNGLMREGRERWHAHGCARTFPCQCV